MDEKSKAFFREIEECRKKTEELLKKPIPDAAGELKELWKEMQTDNEWIMRKFDRENEEIRKLQEEVKRIDKQSQKERKDDEKTFLGRLIKYIW